MALAKHAVHRWLRNGAYSPWRWSGCRRSPAAASAASLADQSLHQLVDYLHHPPFRCHDGAGSTSPRSQRLCGVSSRIPSPKASASEMGRLAVKMVGQTPRRGCHQKMFHRAPYCVIRPSAEPSAGSGSADQRVPFPRQLPGSAESAWVRRSR